MNVVYDVNTAAFLCILSLSLIAGIPGNALILVLNFMKRMKKQVLSSCDIMVTCIAASNVLILCISAAFCYCAMFITDIYSNEKIINPFLVASLLVLCCNLWFSAWLCADYCLRIIHSNSKLFLWLKTTFPKLGLVLVCVTVAASLTIILPGIYDLEIIVQSNITENSVAPVLVQSRCSCFFKVLIPFTSLAFAISLSSVVAILSSLFKHIRRMESNIRNKEKRRLAAHFGAVKTVTFLLLLYVSLYVSQFLIFSEMALSRQQWYWLCCFIIMSFPTVNSVVLIQGNPRLRTTFFTLLQKIRCGN